MALLKRGGSKLEALDKDFLAKLNEGRTNLQRTAPKRDEAWEFVRGNHYAYIDANNKLQFLPTQNSVAGKKGKPGHRARQARNLIFDVVLREESNASQQVPSYQVVPSTTEPEDVSAASLSEKILLYGYERWDLRQVIIEAVAHAVVGGEAFVWIYFDNTIGPFVSDQQGSVGTGDVRGKVYGGNECFWVPGLRFEESPWHVVEQACDPSAVKAMPGYEGGELTPDAQSRGVTSRTSDKAKLVQVSHFLERPCPQYQEGRWITIANGKRIMEDRAYPSDGEDPVLRRLVYAPDPDSDRDMGLVPQLLDAMRTKNDADSKAVEWKNHCLFPRLIVAPGLMKKQRWTDEVGKVTEIPNPDQNVKVIEVPPIPSDLYTMADRAAEDLLRIAGQQDIPPGVEAAKAIQAFIERNQSRSAMFIASLAKLHSQIGHDCLVAVQENYTEPRLIPFRGDFGWETISDFKGAQLRDQLDVRVYADSIEPQTAQARQQRIMNYIQMGAIDPVAGMTAIETGATEGLIRSFAQDTARVGRIIRNLKAGPNALGAMPTLPTGRLEKVPQIDPTTNQPVIDPMTQQPVMVDGPNPEMAPAWMPRYSDNLAIFRTTFEDFLKGEEYERLPPEVQDAANQIYGAILRLSAEKDAEAQAAQTAQAQQLGMNNAARPQGAPKPNPSLPGLGP